MKDLSDFLTQEHLASEDGGDLPRRLFPCILFLEGVSSGLGNRLVEGAGRVGGWAARVRAISRSEPSGAVLLCGAPDGLLRLAEELDCGGEREHLSREIRSLVGHLTRDVPDPIRYREKTLDVSRGHLLMAVLNVTPDSFYDGGRYLDSGQAEEQALKLIDQGADILDVGGASSRPGSDRVPDQEEIDRVLPVIRAVRSQWDGWISVDTYSARVARAALDEGADMINDISAGKMDPAMMGVAAETGAPAVLMHMKGTPKDMQKNPVYDSLLAEIVDAFEEGIRDWERAGCKRENLLIDPGIGFGKTLDHNLRILRNLEELKVLGRPVVLGTSRKSFIGTLLKRDVEERLAGTLATLAVGAMNGAHIFRVHDVVEARETLALVHAIQKA